MALIDYVKKEDAQGEIAEIYKMMEQRINIVPNVLQFHSASPELFKKFMPFLSHFFDHPTMEPKLIAYIRLLVSNKAQGEYCVRFQSAILKYLGVPEEDIELAKKDYRKTNLENRSKALLVFVLDIMNDVAGNRKEQIDALKELGWAEQDIYEASIIAALQRGMVPVIKAFEVELDF